MCVEAKLSSTNVPQTLSNLTLLPHQIKTASSRRKKFGYLLEMVAPKVREKISNLKPGTLGYKTAGERLQKEHGQTKLVVNAHMDEIIYLTPVKGNSVRT